MRQLEHLVLVPGLVCDARLWEQQRRHLESVACTLVAPADGAETMKGLAEQLLEQAPSRFALAGFSMGGYVALEVLRQAPERVTRLALLDTSARTDTVEKAEGRHAAISACHRGEYRAVIERMMEVLLHPDRRDGPLADLVRAMTASIGPETFIRRHRAMLTRSDSRDLLRAVDVPVRVICGRHDAMNPLNEHEEMADLAPTGRLSVIEECGHMSPIEHPHAVSALMRDWLLYD